MNHILAISFVFFAFAPVFATSVFIPQINRIVETRDLTKGDILNLMRVTEDARAKSELQMALTLGEHRQVREDLTPEEEATARIELFPNEGQKDAGYAAYRRLVETLVGGTRHPALRRILGEYAEVREKLGPCFRARFKAAESMHNFRFHEYEAIREKDFDALELARDYLVLAEKFFRAANDSALTWNALAPLLEEDADLQERSVRKSEFLRIANIAKKNGAKYLAQAQRENNSELLQIALEYEDLADLAQFAAIHKCSKANLNDQINRVSELFERARQHEPGERMVHRDIRPMDREATGNDNNAPLDAPQPMDIQDNNFGFLADPDFFGDDLFFPFFNDLQPNQQSGGFFGDSWL